MLAEHNLERSSWRTDQGIRIVALDPLEPDQGGVILHARSIYGFQEPDFAGTDAGIPQDDAVHRCAALYQHRDIIPDIYLFKNDIALNRDFGVRIVAPRILVVVKMQAQRYLALLQQPYIPEYHIPHSAAAAYVPVL